VGQAIGEGVLAGLALGGIIAALPGSGGLRVHVSGADMLLWLAVPGGG